MVTADLLNRAFTDNSYLVLQPLPEQVRALLETLNAPPRLVAHLRAVHDVATQLVTWIQQHYPDASCDEDAVLFGAATHDVGKVIHNNELSEPGSLHEYAGYQLLLEHGIAEELARFARTHGSWDGGEPDLAELLVSLADKIWKGKRVPDLEQLVVHQLVKASEQPAWQVFMAFDSELERIAQGSDCRLAFQSSYPIS